MADIEFTTEELETEEWRDVVGYEGIYSVSNLGRLRRDSSYGSSQIGKIQKPARINKGYLRYRLSDGPNHTTWTVAHRIVMAAFVRPEPLTIQVNHKDGDKTNNRLSNLEYCTASENMQHAQHVLGLFRGEKASAAKLTEGQVKEIWHLKGQMSGPKVAKHYGIYHNTVYGIWRRITWKHITAHL